ncbi:MAG: hypothetical protein EOO73_28815 [Myxococcales bacterium]|nr:MAG: hypothetical protein EOO73_28815 [Myxococcales bacterium]
MNRWTMAQSLWGLSLLCSVGCGGRADEWDVPFAPTRIAASDPTLDPSGGYAVRGLTGSVALLDQSLNEVLMLTSPRRLELEATRLPVGLNVVRFESSAARDRLFVLSRGVTPRFKETDEPPQLMVFDGGIAPEQLARYALKDPYDQLVIDPMGKWLIVHGSDGLVSNPNELLLIQLPEGAGEAAPPPRSVTLNSYGGKPKRFVFTGELTMPNEERHRLLVVQREKDLAIIDLDDEDSTEITVGLPQDDSGGFESPVDVVFHDGIPGEVGAMLAVQLAEDPNVYILPIQPPESDEHAFSLGSNLVDVGGNPSMLDFVRTSGDGGLRLAALVPSKQAAKLIDPTSSKVTDVALPVPFRKIRRVTSEVGADAGQDIALLYGATANTIAFWQLGVTVGTPYRSIDAYDLGIGVDQVLDVPTGESAEFANRKILAGQNSLQFYVLDLSERKSFPLDTLSNLTLNLSPNGQQLWAFQPNATGFAQLTFDPLQPASLYAEEPIAFVHDFATSRGQNERTAIALHFLARRGSASLAATLFDGNEPRTDETRFYPALELRGIE